MFHLHIPCQSFPPNQKAGGRVSACVCIVTGSVWYDRCLMHTWTTMHALSSASGWALIFAPLIVCTLHSKQTPHSIDFQLSLKIRSIPVTICIFHFTENQNEPNQSIRTISLILSLAISDNKFKLNVDFSQVATSANSSNLAMWKIASLTAFWTFCHA